MSTSTSAPTPSSSSATPPTPIIVWCHPRSCSTAFERALMQRSDTHVFHEPLGDPFYYSQSRACNRYDDDTCRATEHWNTTLESVTRSLLVASPDAATRPESLAPNKQWPPKYVFIKDMAQYIFPADRLRRLHPESKVYPATKSNSVPSTPQLHQSGDYDPLENPTVLPTWLLRRFKHTFLIRTPEKSVPSYWKCVEEKAAGFEYFDGAEAGYAELRILYDWLANPKSTFNTYSASPDDESSRPGTLQHQPLPPPLIDAKVLLAHPEHTVSQYCHAVGIPFDRQMLSWESGPVEEWKKWGTYHKGAENSTGFQNQAPEPAQQNGGDKKKPLPRDVEQTIEACMADYQYLAERTTIKEP
ncbi:uncharacterized protein PFL1_03894 [Pseudozyma flocculosa PF-1]|uniref:Uncharacterized protein n=2 Tax=Pseudozyma flocculosa TaxID=84751 RepID=A0A5C3EXE5_9BASI|nr:uncharacterized protein PFL1_03894 [Pseudozyma flocculosa PF-1]EPQ28591.1 hypothetical protein PFL1_03894 [Pseudozyma flocculosa PF-1]SPO36530.1 uncharacterized protein PSFLO_02001 [Pseudozyma flocculosa]